jgi:hypothetical protein
MKGALEMLKAKLPDAESRSVRAVLLGSVTKQARAYAYMYAYVCMLQSLV